MKSGSGQFSTTNITNAEWIFPPPLPVIVKLYEPAGVDEEVVIVRFELPDGVTDPGLKLALHPLGSPDTLRLTEELNPF